MAASSDNAPASIPPRPGSTSIPKIDPQLETVLRNLNVNLEDELTRYRRQRHGRVPPPPPPRRAAQRKTIDLISVSASSPEVASQPPPPPNPFLQKDFEAEEDNLSEQALEQISAMDEPDLDVDESDQTAPEPDDTQLPVHAKDMPTDSYLESSEELLKSIEEEQADPASVPEPYSPDRKNNSLLKLAGLVLVLLGGIGVGFAITYPSQLQGLRSRLWPAGDESVDTVENVAETDEAPPQEPTSDTSASDETPEGYKPPGPDLSTREFKELDDVEDLVTLDLEGADATATPSLSNPAQSPLPAPTTTAQPAPNAIPETADNPTNAPTPSAALPAPDPVPTTSAAATGSNFYVIAGYTGDASLNKARELVPDAFVRNFQAGARIQLAAFNNRAQAEEQVAFLTQQGIAVELFGPTNE